MDNSLLNTLRLRQKRLMADLLQFLRISIVIAFAGFLITAIIQWATGNFPAQHRGLLALSNPTLGSLIASFLSLISILVMWIFTVWSVILVPYISIQAYKISRELEIQVGTKALRWAELWISTFLPLVIFAMIWNIVADPNSVAELDITTLGDGLVVLAGSIIVVGLLWLINSIPTRYVTVHLAVISSLLYLTLLLTYGVGFGLASNCMLFGVLIYLTFGLEKFGDLVRRITVYDLDSDIVEKLQLLMNEVKKAETQRDATSVIKEINLKEQETKLEQMGQDTQIRMDAFLLKILQTKYDRTQQIFNILSSQLSQKLDISINEQIEQLQRESSMLTQEELERRTSMIMSSITSATENVPEQLATLRQQVVETSQQYQQELRAIEERKAAVLLNERNPSANSAGNDVRRNVDLCFDRLRNLVMNQAQIDYLNKDALVVLSEDARKACIASINSGHGEVVRVFVNALNDKMATILELNLAHSNGSAIPNYQDRYGKLLSELVTLLKKGQPK